MNRDDDARLVTIASFRDLFSAQFHKGLLEENGVDAFLPEENTKATGGLWALGAQPVRLQVPACQLERAKALLQEAAERPVSADAPPEQLEDAEGNEAGHAQTVVPPMISSEAERGAKVYWGIMLALLIAGAAVFWAVDFLVALLTR